MGDPLLTIILIAFFLVAEGFYSGSEFALISFNRIRLRHMAENGIASAKILETLLQQPDKIFGVTSVGTNVCVFAGTAIATAFLAEHISSGDADLYAFLIMGPVTLVLGEIVPKMVTRHNSEKIVSWIGNPLRISQKFFEPILAVTSFLSRIILKLFMYGDQLPATMVTREEILGATKLSEEKLDLDQDEKKMIDRIFEFRASDVDSSMQPLVNLVAVPSLATLAVAKDRIAKTGYSRLPVFHERIYNIVGIISAFDILRCHDLSAPVDKVMHPAYFTPETKKNSDLMSEMQADGVHMAVVVDEYGGATGIVTMEDLLEEIVGEIEDEYDSPVKFYDKLDDRRYIIDAMMEVDSINEELGLALPTGDYETMSGLLNNLLERIPHKLEKLAIGPYFVMVLDATSQRAKSVELIDLSEKTETGKPESGHL
ncbi:Magnesium and cobalt efflux protein CorC [hydrothermal vent metagenome]|uniref:Magnesium and cobalt efflux protein CorC n=1 Tax=hydrothermal vent metagenome TaxID=652676 RepID=A0A3B1C046_9ZZZZ